MEKGSESAFWNCRIDTSGRILLPQQVRLENKLDNGDELVVTVEDGAIILRNYSDAMQRLQNAFCDGLPNDVSLSNELIIDRRHEAEREQDH